MIGPPNSLARHCAASLFVFTAFVSLSPSAAADELDSTATIFYASDFEQYAPLNALDMVERIPGFRLSEARSDDQSRGLGQASQNVLINGQRISGKSASASEVLERIPSNSVERIELLDGTKLNIPGLTGLVVNVISEETRFSGTWLWRPSFRPNLKPFLDGGDLSLIGQIEDLGWSLNFSSTRRGSTAEGNEFLQDSAGVRVENRDIFEEFFFPEWNVGGSLSWEPPSGLIVNLNAEFENSKRDFLEISDRSPVLGTFEQRDVKRINETTIAEISADAEFGLGPGRLKVIGLYSDSDSPFTNSIEKSDEIGSVFEERFFRQRTDETETILRAEYHWPTTGGTWDVSFESALNNLESDSFLLAGDGISKPVPVDIGSTKASVEETRNEAFLSFSREIAGNVQLQASIGAEVSQIRSFEPSQQSRTFTRPKGGVSLSWTANEQTTINARIDRKVGQLDFFDFVSQVDLNDGENQIGNTNIVPEQRWRGELEIERKFGKWGAGSFLIFGESLEDIVDQIPIGDGEGPGNIDNGRRYGGKLEGTLNFDPLGWNGAQLVYSVAIQNSEIDDLLTFAPRAINEEELLSMDLEFRHDIAGHGSRLGR